MSPACWQCSTKSALDLQATLDMGITLFAGEAEGRIDEVFCAMPPKTHSSQSTITSTTLIFSHRAHKTVAL
jgi:hypothetical protein